MATKGEETRCPSGRRKKKKRKRKPDNEAIQGAIRENARLGGEFESNSEKKTMKGEGDVEKANHSVDEHKNMPEMMRREFEESVMPRTPVSATRLCEHRIDSCELL